MNKRRIGIVSVLIMVVVGGLIFGRVKEATYLPMLNERKDFLLQDYKGEFFHLSKMPKEKVYLLIFTPDEIFQKSVGPMAEFNLALKQIREKKVEVVWITRTNRDIVLNFRSACGFPGTLLIDMGGTVGKRFDLWPTIDTVRTWGYALVNSEGEVFKTLRSENVLTAQEVINLLDKSLAAPVPGK